MDIASITRGVFRIGVALLFGMHDLQKLFGFFGGRPVPLISLLGVAGVLEVVGSTLLLLGLLTRPVARYALAFVFFAGNGAGVASADAVMQRRGVDTAHGRATRPV